jgi:hypothetical protein
VSAVVLTGEEAALLRAVHHDIAPCVASLGHLADLQEGTSSGGGHGFDYMFGRSKFTGRWCEWFPVRWASERDIRPTGEPIYYRSGRVLAEVTMTYTRLRRWCESLPEDVRAQALVWWRTWPVETRDIPKLNRLVLDQLPAPDAVERERADRMAELAARPEPTDLLGLLAIIQENAA